jgi:succinate dehydrogenase / fumarate reductase iron-sulfur subunit
MAKIKIQKYDPSKDKKPYFEEYEFDCTQNQTVLEVLNDIKENKDPTLGFRHSCKAGICGSCSMRINGRARLTCKLMAADEIEKFGEILIQPIGNLKIEKDLIVDMEPFYKEMKAVKPWFDRITGAKVMPDDVKKIEKSSECIWCAACFSDCPSRDTNKGYLGPAASVLAHRYIDDVRDDSKRERLVNLVRKQLWMCAHCEKASENCPQDIEPQEVISKLREKSIKEGLIYNTGARHARTIKNHVEKYGEIIESRLPLGALGPIKIFKLMPVLLRMVRKWKIPPLFIKKVKGWKRKK